MEITGGPRSLAANIAASGRLEALNKRIEFLVEHPEKDNAWWAQVFFCLWIQVCSEYLLLKNAYAEEQRNGDALIAWRTRNLLELSVWCLYCAKSRENAHRLYEDAGKDERWFYTAFTKWGIATAQDPTWLDPLARAIQDLSQRATACGIESLEGSCKEVRDAAEECGIGEHFRLSYRMLSKFAHPTALQILAPSDEARVALRKELFFSHGCLFFAGAFDAIEKAVETSAVVA